MNAPPGVPGRVVATSSSAGSGLRTCVGGGDGCSMRVMDSVPKAIVGKENDSKTCPMMPHDVRFLATADARHLASGLSAPEAREQGQGVTPVDRVPLALRHLRVSKLLDHRRSAHEGIIGSKQN